MGPKVKRKSKIGAIVKGKSETGPDFRGKRDSGPNFKERKRENCKQKKEESGDGIFHAQQTKN